MSASHAEVLGMDYFKIVQPSDIIESYLAFVN